MDYNGYFIVKKIQLYKQMNFFSLFYFKMVKEKSLQQESDEYQFQQDQIYKKYIVDFYNLHKDKDNETIKQLYKEHLHLIVSDIDLQDIFTLNFNKTFTS